MIGSRHVFDQIIFGIIVFFNGCYMLIIPEEFGIKLCWRRNALAWNQVRTIR
jgi:hypothetical protein